MTFREAMSAIKQARRSTPVALREEPWGAVRYRCSCEASIMVLLCHGVGDVFGFPPPSAVTCRLCGEDEAIIDMTESILAIPPPQGAPFIRVPSRKAAREMAQEGRAEGQLVYPDGYEEGF